MLKGLVTVERKQDRARRILREMDRMPRNLARMFEEEAIDAIDSLDATDALLARMIDANDRTALNG